MFVALLPCLLFVSWGFQGEVRIFLIGDSTVADKPEIDNPERGWGQMFPWFFDRGVVVENHARNGRSTKSFINENRWQRVLEALRPGDYVFIQFGHNDSKKEDTTRYAAPYTSYKQNLLRFVRESRSKGAIPILITPVSRRKFDESGRFVDSHGDYPKVVREVAKKKTHICSICTTRAKAFSRRLDLKPQNESSSGLILESTSRCQAASRIIRILRSMAHSK